MSYLDLVNEEDFSPDPNVPLEAPASTLGDVRATQYEDMWRRRFWVSETLSIDEQARKRKDRYQEITGRSLLEDVKASLPEEERVEWERAPHEIGKHPRDIKAKQRQQIDDHISRLKAEEPERFKDLRTYDELVQDAADRAKEAKLMHDKASLGATNFDRFVGDLLGGLQAQFVDPMTYFTAPMSAGASAGIVKTAVTEGLINMGTEVAEFPWVKEWNKRIGVEYGVKELKEELPYAFLGGAGFSATLKGLGRVYNFVKGTPFEKDMYSQVTALRIMAKELQEQGKIAEADAFLAQARHMDTVLNAPKDIDPVLHQRAMEVVREAQERGTLPDLSFLDEAKLQKAPVDPIKQKEKDDLLSPVNKTEAPKKRKLSPQEQRSEIGDEVSVKRMEELAEEVEKPEYGKYQKDTFKARVEEKKLPKEHTFRIDEETAKEIPDLEVKDGRVSLEKIEKYMDDNKKSVSAISGCGIGGGGAPKVKAKPKTKVKAKVK